MHPAALASSPTPVGILGGMGPAAGADFVRLFVDACGQLLQAAGRPVTDQAYPAHWLAQLPVPDRSAALAAHVEGAAADPLTAMTEAARQLQALGVRSLALACNTAHAWHAKLQAALPELHLLHGVQEVAHQVAAAGLRDVVVLATTGTVDSGLYQQALARAGVTCHLPSPADQALLMEGIYRGVKAGRLILARQHFVLAAQATARRHGCTAALMACTEIPLALQAADLPGMQLIDATACMARALALRAYGLVRWPAPAEPPCGGFPAGPPPGAAP